MGPDQIRSDEEERRKEREEREGKQGVMMRESKARKSRRAFSDIDAFFVFPMKKSGDIRSRNNKLKKV